MAYQVRDLPALLTATTSSTMTNGIGKLDDAGSITIYMSSSAANLTSGSIFQVSQFDPFDTAPPVGVTQQSTQWYAFSLTSTTGGGPLISSGNAFTISNISFRGIRISTLATANVAGEIIAFATKQINVSVVLSLLATSVFYALPTVLL